ncbi:c-type cytochrome domain-containing protein [Agriterribacter sp.]|uniref:c-type cytochrome domain-containing protein n=1 Tax=Agriterribacter sp. TaxID=2821509 RepID=UPI002CC60750|nr:c-type cytochrome domain-containing protein [Agriterribacter sp.]HTN08428.1 c-type cytochrome domain-containing protein [Agriterribacter sp.]
MHTDWSLFFGSFHPLIVHIPIGIILFAALLNGIALYKKSRTLQSAISIALLIGSLGAALAAVSGYFLAANGGYDAGTLFWHKWTGIAAAVIGFCAWWIRTNKRADILFLKTRLSAWLLSVCVLLIIAGGHFGGTMTHGEGYLTAHMPAFLRSVFPETPRVQPQQLPAQLDSVQVFAHVIQPILSAKCVSCHNPGKQQGDLVLNSPEAIMKGGKSGNTLVPGDIGRSELVYRVGLDPHNTKFMPANNQPPLTTVEAGLLKWWVASGADFTKNIAESKLDEKTRYLLAFYLGFDEENDKEIILPEVARADSNVVRQLKEMKLIVRTLTAQSNLLDISFVMMRQSSPEQKKAALQLLLSVKEQVYRLDVSNCALTGEEIKMIATLPHLNKLEMQKNNLTDEAVAPLKALQQLVSLNLGQNDITVKSATVFQQLAALQKINLWQTRFTEEDVKQLQDTMKGVVVER